MKFIANILNKNTIIQNTDFKYIFKWDKYSDQPYIITNKKLKKQQKQKYFLEYIKIFLLFIFIFPIAFIFQFFNFHTKAKTKVGIGVNLDKGKEQYELIKELNAKYLLVRIPLWGVDKIDDYVNFIQGFGKDKNILINILQDREHIENNKLLKKNISIIFEKLQHIASEYQIGNAVNRTKWGFFAMSEYLKFYKTVQNIRDTKFPKLQIIGPSVIDFEYYYISAALFNFYNIKFDKLSTLLYVDRRGAPNNKQYGFFNTKNKIKLLASIVKLSPKVNNEIYITEVNWPLKNTKPYAPTSEKECISENDYVKYMQDYIKTVKHSQQVDRVYWHQLIAPGYGLVDNRDGVIRKTPAFNKFKQLINN